MEYQQFSVFGKDLPGFNDFIAAAKTRNKNYNGYNALKQRWSKKLVTAITAANIFPIDKIFLYLIWCEPNKRRDPDNIASFIKFILDALQKASIIKNDGWGCVKGWRNEFMVGHKRGVEVRIYDTEEEYNTAF